VARVVEPNAAYFSFELPNMLGTKTPAAKTAGATALRFLVTPAVFAAGVLRATVHGVCPTDSAFPKLGKSIRH